MFRRKASTDRWKTMRDGRLREFTSGLVVAFAMFTPVATLGQEMGERVRVTLAGDTTVVGFVTAIRSGELELAREGGGRQVVVQDGVERLERSVEQRQWKTGSLIGAGVGAGLGVALWVRGEESCLDIAGGCVWVEGFWNVPPTAIAWGLVGMGIGALVKRSGWEPIQGWGPGGGSPGLSADVRVGPLGRTYLGGRIRFWRE